MSTDKYLYLDVSGKRGHRAKMALIASNIAIQNQSDVTNQLLHNSRMDTNQILIVDDDREIRTLLADYLQTNGYKCFMAAEGNAMWHTLSEHDIDLVVLDLNMPGEDGLTLCRNLR